MLPICVQRFDFQGDFLTLKKRRQLLKSAVAALSAAAFAPAFAQSTPIRLAMIETLSVDLPGIAKDQLNIGIEGAVVRLESTETAARKVKAAYELPLEIDASASSATLENGVLTLKLAKKLPVSNVTQLAIQ